MFFDPVSILYPPTTIPPGSKSYEAIGNVRFIADIYWLIRCRRLARADGISIGPGLEAAKKEGKLVWYTSMAIDTSKPLLDAFVKEYPFIKAELVRAGEEQLMNRILSETRAGQWLFDAISTSAMGALVDRHLDHALCFCRARRVFK